MSDFSSDLWHWYVTVPTLLGIAGCAWLLWAMGKQRVARGASIESSAGAASGGAQDNSTGHIWDGDLMELNNPLPRWWVGLFAITIVFSVVYLVIFPGLGRFSGSAGWSSTTAHETEVAEAAKLLAPLYARFETAEIPALQADPKAMGIAERLFLNNCAQCHGSDGRGSNGFPNLADADWLYGGTAEAVITTITQGRSGLMPPMATALGSPDDVRDMVQFVLSISGKAADSARVARGASKFVICAGCHGADGHGNQSIGAPNLSDRTWLYGGSPEAIRQTIEQGRNGVMPAHATKFSTSQIRLMAAYVLGMGKTP
jgi:cytochrome c oxidase cbb3-type subunit 3